MQSPSTVGLVVHSINPTVGPTLWSLELENRQPLDWASLPSVKQEIDRVYKLAHESLRTMASVGYHRFEWATIGAISIDPDAICTDSDFGDHLTLIRDVIANRVEQLQQLLPKLADLRKDLQHSYLPLMDLLDYSFPCALGNIDFGKGSGRCAFYFFYSESIGVEDWTRKYIRLLKTKSFHEAALDELNQSFPFSDHAQSQLYSRLNVERSQVLKDLPNYVALLPSADRETSTRQEAPESTVTGQPNVSPKWNPSQRRAVQLAIEWLTVPSKYDGPTRDQPRALRWLIENGPSTHADWGIGAEMDWSDDVRDAARKLAGRINRRARKCKQKWEIHPENNQWVTIELIVPKTSRKRL